MHCHSFFQLAPALFLFASPILAYNDMWGDHTGSQSSWPYGAGTQVDNNYDSDFYGSGDHCWTELWVVDHVYFPGPWTPLTQIDCAGTSSCSAADATAKMACTTWTVGVTINPSVQASLAGIFTIGQSVSLSYSYSSQQCTTTTITDTCTYSDQLCHSVFNSNVMVTAVGYITRRCNYVGGAQGAAVWGFDVNATTPTNTQQLGCDGSCSSDVYPSALPVVHP